MIDLKQRATVFTKTQQCGEPKDSYRYGPETYNQFRLGVLRNMLKKRDLRMCGNKKELVQRLVNDNLERADKRIVEKAVEQHLGIETEMTVAPEEKTEVRKFNYAGNIYLVDTANAVYCLQTHVHIGRLNMESKKIEFLKEISFTPPDEQEEIKVIRFCYKNAFYWKNESTGNIYSRNNGHRVGTYNDSTNKIAFLNSFN
jgi:hypothetical protein